MKDKIDLIKEKHTKLAALLDEYSRAKKAKQCTHQLDIVDKYCKLYVLVDLSTKQVVCDGLINRIKGYMNRRNIDKNNVLDYPTN